MADKTRYENILKEVENEIKPFLEKVENVSFSNQAKVLDAFTKNQVSEADLNGSTGYGSGDVGRDKLERVYSEIFGTESALVRPQFVSGTHAIACALFSVVKPGEKLLYITGQPYDTLQEVIGTSGNGIGSLLEYGIEFDFVELNDDGSVNFAEVRNKMTSNVTAVAIQRSRGYSKRASFTVNQIEEMVEYVKDIKPVNVFVDNCYGELAEEIEPTQVGADIMAGSLIKNLGGGIAKTGGYVVGKENLVERASYRLTAPGIGKDEGATLSFLRDAFQGLFVAPEVVSNAIKGSIFTSGLLAKVGFKTTPRYDELRTDLIQYIEFGTPEKMIEFAQLIQENSPIDSFAKPMPTKMSGYEDEVIMAAGTFVEGASIELSVDGPIREPYSLYMQGGLTYNHVKITISRAVKKLMNFA